MLTVGLIGCGRIGALLEEDPLRLKPATHAGAFTAYRHTRITCAADLNPDRLAYMEKKYGLPPDTVYLDYREMLDREKPDIVSVAAWTEYHAEMVMEAAALPSTKGIYCEKPIALTTRDADRMIRTCHAKNIPLLVGHERRFDANFAKVKKMIDKQELGELKTIVAQTLSLPVPELPVHKYGGGSIFHDGTHLFDLVLYFGGPADWVMGFDHRPHGKKNVEATSAGIARLKNGATVLFEGGGEREYFKFDLDLQFTRGRIVIGNGGIHMFASGKSRHYTGFRELQPVEWKQPKNWQNSFTGAVKELAAAIRHNRQPNSNGREARDSLALIEAVYRSAARNGKKVHLNGR